MNVNQKLTLNMGDFENLSNYYGDYNESYTYGEGVVCSQESSMHFDATFVPILYSLALVVGLLGNGLVLVVLWKKSRILSVTDIFILHLCLADLLLLLTLPFWAVDAAKGWLFGTPLCKLTAAVFKINFYCGIFMLSCISLDRYLSIVHAVQMYSRKKPMVIHCCCLMVWFFCFLLSIPEWVYHVATVDSRRQDKIECVADFPKDNYYALLLFTRLLYHILGFALPATVMVFCYTLILLRLQRGSQCLQKRRAMRVIVALVLAFFICWTPYNITLIIDTIHSNTSFSLGNHTCDTITDLDVALTATSTLAYLHCCVNPVLYAFVGVKFRQQLLNMLRPLGFTLKGPAGLVSRKSSAWSDSVDTSHTSAF